MKWILKNKLILLFITILLLMGFSYAYFFPGVTIKQNKSQKAFQRGFYLYNRYKYKASIDYFLQSLSYNPEFAFARKMLGKALYSSGQVDEAIAEWKLLFETGIYDPSLDVHIRNITSAGIERSQKWYMKAVIKPEKGYRFSYPVYVTPSPNETTFILSHGQLDTGNIIEINNNYQFLSNKRRITEKLGLPVSAAFDEKEMWITDIKNDKIYRADLSAKLPFLNNHKELGKKGSGELEFHGPAGITYCDGYFYVADSGNDRIQKINSSGIFSLQFSRITEYLNIKNPFGIACSKDQKIYVSEPDNGRIVVFDVYGNFYHFLGESILKKPRHLFYDSKRDLLIVSDEIKGIILFDQKTKEIKTIDSFRDEKTNTDIAFKRPYSAYIDSYGNIYIADMGAHRVYHFVPEEFLYSNLNLWIQRIDVSHFPNIGVWVKVKDHMGNPIYNLEAENFQIRENNGTASMLNISYLKQFHNRDRWIVVISRSDAMKEYQEIINWIAEYLFGNLREKDRIMIIGYNDTYKKETPWTNSYLGLKNQLINGMNTKNTSENPHKTSSKMATSLYWAVSQLLPERGNRNVIWITDGNLSEDSRISLNVVENFAIVNDIPMHVINLQNPEIQDYKSNIERLKQFAEKTGGSYYFSYDKLNQMVKDFRNYKEKSYVINYKSPLPKSWKGQFIDLSIRVKFHGRDGKENYGYFIP